MIYDEEKVLRRSESSRESAVHGLETLEVYCGREPHVLGLSGWVFEQAVQSCIKEELEARESTVDIGEQVPLGGKIKADLAVGTVAIEVKRRGLFGAGDMEKYRAYRQMANANGLEYLYITGQESYQPYRNRTVHALGRENAFFLDTPGEWARFINRLVELLAQPGPGC